MRKTGLRRAKRRLPAALQALGAAGEVALQKASALEIELLMQIRGVGLHEPVPEHRFCERRWRFDFAWPEFWIACEAEGGTWAGGRHTRGAGYAKDAEKYNHATALGWRVFRYTADMIKSGEAITQLESVFDGCLKRQSLTR